MGDIGQDLGMCSCCKVEPAIGVASIPGAPMSIAWGRECLTRDCQPWFIVLGFLDDGVPPGINPADHMADWFLDEQTYINAKDLGEFKKRFPDYGKDVEAGYVTIRDLFPKKKAKDPK